jgi:hypothetical protein
MATGHVNGNLSVRGLAKGQRSSTRWRETGLRWQNRKPVEVRSRAFEGMLQGKGAWTIEGISDRISAHIVHAVGSSAV